MWVKDIVMDFLVPIQTDLTALVNAQKPELEALLGEMNDDPDMVKKIYQYSLGEVTVDMDNDREVGIVYIDGIQKGLHIQGKHYFMYGVHIGDLETEAHRNITFPYTDHWQVLNDLVNGTSTAYFYTNKENNDCMAVKFE